MLFNSYIFIFIFFPLCITGFYLLNKLKISTYAKMWLIAFSLWFYGYFNVSYLAIMIISILLNYCLTLWITREKTKTTWKKSILAAGVILNLAILFYFKYFDFFIESINSVFKSDFPLKHILLPLGISFFTFQQIGFLVDTYRGDIDKIDFVDYALFVSFFPQLIAGPIVSQDEMLPQFKNIQGRRADYEGIARGLTLFVLGLAKKVLIADTLGASVDIGYQMIGGLSGLDSFCIMIWYSLQLYFDFSGYCDMARGLAQMLGFELPVNFDSPYKASNIVDFWKLWHRTLTRFFTRYVYIPLGGNRKGFVRMLINVLIVYFLSGLWHGAGYNFILWGMLHGIMYVIVRLFYRYKPARLNEIDNISQSRRVLNWLAVVCNFIYVSFAWIFFRATSIADGLDVVKHMFTSSWRYVSYPISEAMKMDELWYVVKILRLDRYPFSQNLAMIIVSLVAIIITFAAPNAAYISENIKPKRKYAVLIAILGIWCVLTLSEVSTFLYFNF